MKKHRIIVGALMMMAMQPQLMVAANDSEELRQETFPSESREQEWTRSENEISEIDLAQMPFDAFLSESGYIVYPVEENCAVLQAKITKNPLILRKDFIPRNVRVIRRVDGRPPEEAARGVMGKQFMIVTEIGSLSRFMVDLKDLHYVQNKELALGNKSSELFGLKERLKEPAKARVVLPKPKTRILFVCSGNYYRSRFAEAYVKYLIKEKRLPVEVSSRGLEADIPRTDSVSPFVIGELARRNIPESYAQGSPTLVNLPDLASADIVVAMNRQEHQAALEGAFPQENAKVRYWEIKDGGVNPTTTCANITYQVQALLQEVAGISGSEVSYIPNSR